jgi:hypothetical protein
MASQPSDKIAGLCSTVPVGLERTSLQILVALSGTGTLLLITPAKWLNQLADMTIPLTSFRID